MCVWGGRCQGPAVVVDVCQSNRSVPTHKVSHLFMCSMTHVKPASLHSGFSMASLSAWSISGL